VRVAVTGAFGFTGKYVARRLLARGHTVLSLTGHPARVDPFGGRVEVRSFDFDRPRTLAGSLRGVDVLVNTYWIRFERGEMTFALAVRNTRRLFVAAREGGVGRVVHVSITNADAGSALPYFRGKGLLEQDLRNLGISWSILRPAVIFGPEDILINNIAWLLRRLPVFGIPGDGTYGLQPIYVEDLAELLVEAVEDDGHLVADALGPHFYTFNELVTLLAQAVGSRARIVHLPARLALGLTRLLNPVLRDVLLTRDEVEGLGANLLVTASPPTGQTSLAAWLAAHRDEVGRRYHSEIGRHFAT
jgi:NADH dehydrogenase